MVGETIDFYYVHRSVPCRACMLTARDLELNINLKPLELLNDEHKKPAFLEINPQHTVPTITDGDFVLWESRAICGYLVSQYGSGDWLYPEDCIERAAVDRVLQFDMGTLYARFIKYVRPVMFQGATPDPAALKSLQEALRWLDGFLAGCKFSAGNNVTVADHCLAATVETIRQCKITYARYGNIKAWLERCEATMKGYEENVRGAKLFGARVQEKFAAVAQTKKQ